MTAEMILFMFISAVFGLAVDRIIRKLDRIITLLESGAMPVEKPE